MRVETKQLDGVKVIKITGQIRISTQNEFKDLLDGIVNEKSIKCVVLNMEGVIYMNSAGLGLIIDAYKKFKEMNRRLVLCSLTPDITKLFEVTRINRFIELYNSENEAVNSF